MTSRVSESALIRAEPGDLATRRRNPTHAMNIKPFVTRLLGLAALAAAFAAPARAATPTLRLATSLDQAILSSAGDGAAILKVAIRADAAEPDAFRLPISLAIVLDRSGSMSGEKLEMAKQAAIQAFESLRRGDRVSIIAYDHDIRCVLPMTRVELVEDPASLIRSIQAGGNTAIYEGVSQAANQFARIDSHAPIGARRILLLSDGLANVGPSQPDDFKSLGRALDREGISVSTVGLGLDYNEDLMAALASSSQGNVYFVENEGDLPRIFQAELGETSKLVARSATIEIDCQGGFRPIRIIGREGRIEGARVIVDISQLYAGGEKYVLIEIDNPGGKPQARQTVAKVKARIQNIITGMTLDLADACVTTFSEAPEIVAASVNIAVQRDAVANFIALAQDEAVALADEGKPQEAARVLLALNTEIDSRNASWNDPLIAAESAKLRHQGETIDRDGIDKRSRKELRASSYQAIQQQSAK